MSLFVVSPPKRHAADAENLPRTGRLRAKLGELRAKTGGHRSKCHRFRMPKLDNFCQETGPQARSKSGRHWPETTNCRIWSSLAKFGRTKFAARVRSISDTVGQLCRTLALGRRGLHGQAVEDRRPHLGEASEAAEDALLGVHGDEDAAATPPDLLSHEVQLVDLATCVAWPWREGCAQSSCRLPRISRK